MAEAVHGNPEIDRNFKRDLQAAVLAVKCLAGWCDHKYINNVDEKLLKQARRPALDMKQTLECFHEQVKFYQIVRYKQGTKSKTQKHINATGMY